MTLLFIAVVILALWVMYDTGELMSDKIRLQNTADNVAYSSAALVSRDLNFIAYTNRAMVANQVAIAQLVGISSWAASIEQLATNIDTIGQFIPFVNVITGAIEAGASVAADAIDVIVGVVIPINDGMIGLLSTAQWIYHSALPVQLAGFSNDIGQRNDPDAMSLLAAGDYSFAEAAQLLREWSERIGAQNQLHGTGDGSADATLENRRFREFEAVVGDSRDRFSSNRSYNWGYPFSATYAEVGLGRIRTEARKYGGSDFFRSTDPSDQMYRWDWAAMETVSQYVEICIGAGPLEECWGLPEIPFAWGAAHALDNSQNASFFDYGFSSPRRSTRLWGNGAWRNSSAASALLTSAAPNPVTGDHVQHRVATISGLRPYYEFRSDEPVMTGPSVISLYVKRAERMDSQRTIMARSGGRIDETLDTELHGGLLSGQAGAVAKAEPYFMRPTDLSSWRRNDNRLEYGSLFNPFWQPRLVDLTDDEKITAMAIVGSGIVAGGEP